MPRTFKLPHFYHSPIISVVKQTRRDTDVRKRDLSPSVLDFGPVRFKIARHFGFCYGVENAIEIAYQALAENPDKRIFLLSEMIHNPARQRKSETARRPVPDGYHGQTVTTFRYSDARRCRYRSGFRDHP